MRTLAVVLALLLTAATLSAQTAQSADSIAARAREGAAAMQASRFDEAATIYGELATARPGDAGLLLNLGMARYMAGHPAEAIGQLERVLGSIVDLDEAAAAFRFPYRTAARDSLFS